MATWGISVGEQETVTDMNSKGAGEQSLEHKAEALQWILIHSMNQHRVMGIHLKHTRRSEHWSTRQEVTKTWHMRGLTFKIKQETDQQHNLRTKEGTMSRILSSSVICDLCGQKPTDFCSHPEHWLPSWCPESSSPFRLTSEKVCLQEQHRPERALCHCHLESCYRADHPLTASIQDWTEKHVLK